MVQCFQFDEEGNMYIFKAGAGYIGTPKLVKPGDDPISSNYSSQTKYQGNAALPIDNKVTITRDSLMFALCHFITEVKKLDGTNFPG